MKKILLATTALAFSAGMASAQVAVGGYGYMGLINATGAGTTVSHAARLTFTGTVQADHGVTFTMFSRHNIVAGGVMTGNRLRLDVAAQGLTVSVGNTNGAIRSLARTSAFYGFNDGGIFAADTGNVGQADGGQNIYARYTFDGITAGVSTTTAGGAVEAAARYTFSGITVGAGVGSSIGGVTPYAIHASYNGGDWTVAAGYNSTNRLVVTGSYTFDAVTVGAAIQNQAGATAYGANIGYNLGGGATLSATVGVAAGVTTIGAGAFFSF